MQDDLSNSVGKKIRHDGSIVITFILQIVVIFNLILLYLHLNKRVY